MIPGHHRSCWLDYVPTSQPLNFRIGDQPSTIASPTSKRCGGNARRGRDLLICYALRVAPRGCSSEGFHASLTEDASGSGVAAKSEMSDNFTQRGAIMQQHTTRVHPSEETIKIGPLGIRFLLTGDDSNGSVSVFELLTRTMPTRRSSTVSRAS